jgi:DNA-binding response OmpR family regulator
MRRQDAPRRANDVVIVSNTPETLDGLQRYLRDAGMAARCTRDISDCTAVASPSTIAFVLFPDDFAWEQVVVALATLAEQQPRALPVLVTARPDRFERLTAAESVLIVPRPVWGWTILEAIRAHIERQQSRREEGSRAR